MFNIKDLNEEIEEKSIVMSIDDDLENPYPISITYYDSLDLNEDNYIDGGSYKVDDFISALEGDMKRLEEIVERERSSLDMDL